MDKLEDKIEKDAMYKKIWKGEESLKKYLRIGPIESLFYGLETIFFSPFAVSCAYMINPHTDLKSNLINIGSMFAPATITYVGTRIYGLFKKE